MWIDTTNGKNTPKKWNGSAWVAVTDKAATDAADAAAAAQQTADAAKTKANANATAISGLQSSVSQHGDTISSQGQSITSLQNSVTTLQTDKADKGDLDDLSQTVTANTSNISTNTNNITANADSISANASDITSLTSSLATTNSNVTQAQQTADDANTAAQQAAGIANGKGKVIYQASAPTGANQSKHNLWIDTDDNSPHTWNGSEWVKVTDKAATDAAAAAAAAQQAADNAQDAADANANAIASTQATVTQHGNTLDTLSQTVSNNTASIGDKADASALQSTQAQVTQNAGDISSLSSTVSSNSARMPSGSGELATKASVDAESSARVDGDSANASSITAVRADLNSAIFILEDGAMNAGISTYIPIPSTYTGLSSQTFYYHSSDVALRINFDTVGNGFVTAKKFPLEIGRQVEVSFYARRVGSGVAQDEDIWASIFYFDSNGVFTSSTSTSCNIQPADSMGTGGFRLYSAVVTIPNGAHYGAFGASLHAGNQSFVADDLSVRYVSSTSTHAASVVQSMTAGVNADGTSYA